MAQNGVAENTYSRLRGTISDPEWLLLEPLIADIERLKIERNAGTCFARGRPPRVRAEGLDASALSPARIQH